MYRSYNSLIMVQLKMNEAISGVSTTTYVIIILNLSQCNFEQILIKHGVAVLYPTKPNPY